MSARTRLNRLSRAKNKTARDRARWVGLRVAQETIFQLPADTNLASIIIQQQRYQQ